MASKNRISYCEDTILENISRETNKIINLPLNSYLVRKRFEITLRFRKSTIYSSYLYFERVFNRFLKASSSIWKF